VTERRSITQFIEEIPPIRPVVTRLVTWSGRCAQCGEVHSTHPLQTSRAQGAAGNHLGPRAAALAVLLNKHYGLTQRKTCKIFKQGFGLSLTSGGLSQLLDRAAKKHEDDYEQLVQEIRRSPAVYADETSWYVGRPGYWLWVFTTPQATLYHVASSRGHPVARQVLGEEFKNVLISDCAPIYDAFKCPQHKCIAHHQKVIQRQRELPSTHDPTYLNECAQFFEEVVRLAHARNELSPEEFAARRKIIDAEVERLLAQPVVQPGDRKVRNRIKRCHESASLLGCLTYQVDPTNNRAERALRPAVIARKVSTGNKTERGARTWEILASLAATAQQRGEDALATLEKALRFAVPAVPVG
jgi:transposase